MQRDLGQDIRRLWESASTNVFMTRIAHLVDSYSLREIVLEGTAYTALRCHEDSYFQAPHALLGLQTAWGFCDFFPSENKLLPLTQMFWYAVGEAVKEEADVKKNLGTPPSDNNLTLEKFEEAYRHKKFEETFRTGVFLSQHPEFRKKIFAFLFREVLPDEIHLGQKVVYLCRTFEFLESFKWKNYAPFLFSIFHYFIKAPSHIDTYPLVEIFYNQQWKNLLKAFSNEEKVLEEKIYLELKESIYHAEKEETLNKLLKLTQSGIHFDVLLEAVRLSASELFYQSNFKTWTTSLQALPYVQAAFSFSKHLEPVDQMKSLLMAALFVKNMAILSKPFQEVVVRLLESVEEKNNSFYCAEFSIRKGDSSRALGAIHHLIAQNEISAPVLEGLSYLSSKNLYSVLYANDLKFAYASLKSYREANHSLKGIYLKSLVKLLAEEPKEETIYNSLVNTQKIKRGYFSAPSEFNF